MFDQIRNEVLARLIDVDRFCRQSCSPDGDRLAAVGKGLAFVNMYAVYEYCVSGSIQAGILRINSHSIPHCEVRWELLGITLHSQLESVTEMRSKKRWSSRLDLFELLSSTKVVQAAEKTMPGDAESHFYYAHLELIWKIFGIPGPVVPQKRFMGFIDSELVGHRNAVAHGRKTAYEVGRTYTAADIYERVDYTKELCLHLIASLEQHCSDASNMRKAGAAVTKKDREKELAEMMTSGFGRLVATYRTAAGIPAGTTIPKGTLASQMIKAILAKEFPN